MLRSYRVIDASAPCKDRGGVGEPVTRTHAIDASWPCKGWFVIIEKACFGITKMSLLLRPSPTSALLPNCL